MPCAIAILAVVALTAGVAGPSPAAHAAPLVIASAGGLRQAPTQGTTAAIVTVIDRQQRPLGSIQGAVPRLTVHDPAGTLIARLAVESDRVKLRDLRDTDTWKIKRK